MGEEEGMKKKRRDKNRRQKQKRRDKEKKSWRTGRKSAMIIVSQR